MCHHCLYLSAQTLERNISCTKNTTNKTPSRWQTSLRRARLRLNTDQNNKTNKRVNNVAFCASLPVLTHLHERAETQSEYKTPVP